MFKKAKMITDNKNKIDLNSAKQNEKLYGVCDFCGNEFFRTKRSILAGRKVTDKDSCGNNNCAKLKREESNLILYGVKNSGGTKESIVKIRLSNKEKFGVENAAQSPEIKEKIKKTCLEKYGKESYLTTDACRNALKQHCNEKGAERPSQIKEYKEKSKQTSLKKYGVEHYSQSDERNEKIKQTCLLKYNVDNYAKTKECRKKMQKTSMERYGVEHALQNKECLEKLKQTNLERYGFENAMQNSEIYAKARETFLKKYGTKTPIENEVVKQKMQKTNLSRYSAISYLATNECRSDYQTWSKENFGVEYYVQSDHCKSKSKNTCIRKYGETSYSKTDEFKSRYKTTCMEKYGVSSTLCLPEHRVYGKTEKEIKQWLSSLGYDFSPDYKILNGKEIDLYNDKLQLGIEYCGLYWHNEFSPQPRFRDYHFNKYKICKQNNITLITLFEDEWINRNQQCKNFIKGLIGIHKQKIYARNCFVKEIDKNTFFDLCEKEHIRGGTKKSSVYFGIFYNNELLGGMSLGRHVRNTNKNIIVLDRMCFKNDMQIVGGASKLLSLGKKWATNNGYESIITWSDNRWGEGNMYPKIGFVLEADMAPDYSYVDFKNHCRRSKQSLKKSNTKCPKDKPEKIWAAENGLARIWDCGKKRWMLSL